MLRIGLVGVGYLGSRHLKHLRELDGVQVSAVWDIDEIARQRAVDTFGVQAAGSLDDLLSLSDAVDIVTPTSTHFEIASKSVKRSLPTFIEKPICATVAEAEELVELAEAGGIMLQIGHIERFNRALRALQFASVHPRFIEAHRLSPWNHRAQDVSVVYDLMIHDLDLILQLTDSQPVHVHANGVGVITDSVDIATARIEFNDGSVANVTASRISLKQMRKLRMFGERVYIALDLGEGVCEIVGVAERDEEIPQGAVPLGAIGEGYRSRRLFKATPTATAGDALRLELEAFRDAVRNRTSPPVTGEQGVNVLRLAERVVEKIKVHGGFPTV